jgi:hypothetical protein
VVDGVTTRSAVALLDAVPAAETVGVIEVLAVAASSIADSAAVVVGVRTAVFTAVVAE